MGLSKSKGVSSLKLSPGWSRSVIPKPDTSDPKHGEGRSNDPISAEDFEWVRLNEEEKAALKTKMCSLLGVRESERNDPDKEEIFNLIDHYTERCSDAAQLAEDFSLDHFKPILKDLQEPMDSAEYFSMIADEAWPSDFEEQPKGKYVIKAKLIITETSYFQNLPNAVNRFLAGRVNMNYGLMHTALLFGDKVVDWGDYSVVTPRQIIVMRPKLTIDLCDIDLERDQVKMWKLCNKMVEWNTRTYHSTKRNCQQFVDDVLQAMGIKLEVEGALADALKKLKEQGRMEMEYTPPAEVQGQQVKFECHEDLDNYAHWLLRQIPDLQFKHKYDWALLKAYDRAFWLMQQEALHEKNKETRSGLFKKGRPCALGCPFQDPRETGTILPDLEGYGDSIQYEREKENEKENEREKEFEEKGAGSVSFEFKKLNPDETEALRKKLCAMLGVKPTDRTTRPDLFEQIDNYTTRYSDAEILADEFSLSYYQDKLDEIERREYGEERKAEEAWEDDDRPVGKYVIKIKLIVTEITISGYMPNAFTRFVQRHAQMDYGIMHTALLFGDKIVDWGNTSVVTPREISVWHPKLTIDLCNLDLEREQDKLWRMCNRIVEWNTRTYSSTTANCQLFVSDLLSAMGISLQLGGALEKALDKLKKAGRLEMEYSPPIEFGEGAQSMVTFDTHEDLDIYVRRMLNEVPDFQFRHKYDWALLKAYDRAFWLMFYDKESANRTENVEKGRPCQVSCPFIDPRDTGTLLGQKL